MFSKKKLSIVQILIVVAVLLSIISVYAIKNTSTEKQPVEVPQPTQHTATAIIPSTPFPTIAPTSTVKKLPKLLDLGSETCPPCKQMVPILAELKREYAGRVIVEVVDVNENPALAEKYKIYAVPTQIFFDAEGKEVFKHVGFMSKEDLVKMFKDKFGV
ncbi:MAG: thioredoxin family protein [Hyphomonadaceae bacterium]|nr:thioredoxin family protein [Clostridia bacterium]